MIYFWTYLTAACIGGSCVFIFVMVYEEIQQYIITKKQDTRNNEIDKRWNDLLFYRKSIKQTLKDDLDKIEKEKQAAIEKLNDTFSNLFDENKSDLYRDFDKLYNDSMFNQEYNTYRIYFGYNIQSPNFSDFKPSQNFGKIKYFDKDTLLRMLAKAEKEEDFEKCARIKKELDTRK